MSYGRTPRRADPADWSQVGQLHPGDKVRVALQNRSEVTAEFAAATPEGLQLVRNGKEQVDLKQADIVRVYQVLKRSPARASATWIGLAAGFGAGFAIGYVAAGPAARFRADIPKAAVGAAVGLPCAGIGALAGHFAAGKGERLVYRAR
jgi:hypothetical protein